MDPNNDPSYLNAELIDQIDYIQGLSTEGAAKALAWMLMGRLKRDNNPKMASLSMIFWYTTRELSI